MVIAQLTVVKAVTYNNMLYAWQLHFVMLHTRNYGASSVRVKHGLIANYCGAYIHSGGYLYLTRVSIQEEGHLSPHES